MASDGLDLWASLQNQTNMGSGKYQDTKNPVLLTLCHLNLNPEISDLMEMMCVVVCYVIIIEGN